MLTGTKLFWKDVIKVNNGKVKGCKIIKDTEEYLRETWKEYLEDLNSVYTEEHVVANMCVFDGAKKVDYLEEIQ